DGDHHQWYLGRAFCLDETFERFDLQVAFERNAGLSVGGLRDWQVQRACAVEFDIRAGGVEMRVAGDGVAGLAQDGKQDSLVSSALMGGNNVAESGEGADGVLEAVPAFAAGV